MSEQPFITAEGAARLRTELEQLTGPERDTIARRLRDAIQQGDLSENADYHKAKEDQSFLEGRIQELEYVLKNAIVVDKQEKIHEQVEIGATVTVQEANYPPETYYIVGAKETDPRNGKISYVSPIGQALMYSKEGEDVFVETPNGKLSLKILKIM
ncbi:transcription elongation factor GreA [Chloroflexota bacterium]